MIRASFVVLSLGLMASAAAPALAAELRAEIRQAGPTGPGDSLGTVTIADGSGGATIKTALRAPGGYPWLPYPRERVLRGRQRQRPAGPGRGGGRAFRSAACGQA